jgi:hypothetical protein
MTEKADGDDVYVFVDEPPANGRQKQKGQLALTLF